ncbi:hypothetical protein A9Q84_02130 [Halobacteriovorax marinus]|uniref:Uncharacterized protein n=1 Tax=Halobacteriovorax marinus TaxID=97084 RepID=A0A1Y5FCN3_9BACT|nr:hypothetical protein A9Q84_02130 [Halobacteriovorax marinus]
MDNQTQKNAKTLLRILTEDKFKRQRAPYVIAFGALVLGTITYLFFSSSYDNKESYYISRESKLSIKDIDQAQKEGINLEALGDDKRHIVYHLAKSQYNLTILKYLKDTGIDLLLLDQEGKNTLERIILSLKLSEFNLENHYYGNISVLLSLGMKVSDDTIKEISKLCQNGALDTCLKMAFYFKAIDRKEHAKSYAKRSCYSSKDYYICKIASNYILKD